MTLRKLKKKGLVAVLATTAMMVMLGCGGTEVVGPAPDPDPDPTPTGNEVVFDNFDKRNNGQDGKDFSTQNFLAFTKVVNSGTVDTASLSAAGGYWYAYAADDNMAHVATINEAGETVMLTGPNKVDFGVALGSDSLTIAFDCTESDQAITYYAAIEVPLTGTDTDEYDLSNLTEIKIEGTLQGAIRIGLKSNTTSAQYGIAIEKSDQNPEDINMTLNVNDFVLPSWAEVTDEGNSPWETARTQVIALFIELDTMIDNYALIKLDNITFVFNNEDGKKAAFPFLN